MTAHKKSRKGKGYRNEVIIFNLKQEEYIMWLYNLLKNMTYKHGGYKVFYITEPKVRKIEKSRYIDRIVHRWLVDNFLAPVLQKKIEDEKLMWLINEILFSQERPKSLEIRQLHITNVSEIFI